MGLVVRLYDIVSPNKFKLNIGLSPYGSFTQITNSEDPNGEWLPSTSGTTSLTHRNYRTDPICITNNDPPISGSTCFVYSPLEFDTRYFIKLQDTLNVIDNCETSPCINGSELRHIIESIYISDSKTFECYDKIKFEVDYECLDDNSETDCEIGVSFVTYEIVVSDIDVFLNDSGYPTTSIYSYNPSTTALTYLFDSTYNSSDIANTRNKIWVYDAQAASLLEYNITLNPFSQTFNRTITSVFTNAGLCAINDTTLINISGYDVYEIDITTNVASATLKWSMLSGRVVAGDYMYTTTNKLIVTNRTFNPHVSSHITQYDYTTGNVEMDLDITADIPEPYGIFEYGSNIYIVNSNGKVYQITDTSPYTLTLVDDIPITVYGASQIPEKITEDFTPVQ
jgi:hypothetical protein